MIRLFWVDGRLAWPLVGVIAYLSVSLIVLDYAWRVVTMQFDTLLLYALAIDGPLFVVGVGLILRLRRAHAKRSLVGR